MHVPSLCAEKPDGGGPMWGRAKTLKTGCRGIMAAAVSPRGMEFLGYLFVLRRTRHDPMRLSVSSSPSMSTSKGFLIVGTRLANSRRQVKRRLRSGTWSMADGLDHTKDNLPPIPMDATHD